MLNELMQDRELFKTHLTKQETYKEKLESEIADITISLAGLIEDSDTLMSARLFMQRVSERARDSAKLQIEAIVSSALQYVFGSQYSFIIYVVPTNSGPEAVFKVRTIDANGKYYEFSPMVSKGGGIVDILSVSLRFALLEILDYDGFIWFDEPFKQVSARYIENAGRLLNFLVTTYNRQAILITHNEIVAGICQECKLISQEVIGNTTVKTTKF